MKPVRSLERKPPIHVDNPRALGLTDFHDRVLGAAPSSAPAAGRGAFKGG